MNKITTEKTPSAIDGDLLFLFPQLAKTTFISSEIDGIPLAYSTAFIHPTEIGKSFASGAKLA